MRLALASLALLLCGCAAPHRLARTEHRILTYQGRPDGLVREEIYCDQESGGGYFLLTTSDVEALSAIHTNQAALGGGSAFSTGPVTIKVDPQTSQIIEATGSAVGNVVGQAIKTAAK